MSDMQGSHATDALPDIVLHIVAPGGLMAAATAPIVTVGVLLGAIPTIEAWALVGLMAGVGISIFGGLTGLTELAERRSSDAEGSGAT